MFIRKASDQVDDLVDDVNHAESTFNEVVKYYGEDERNMSSSEFYGIFKTFVTSYKVHLELLYYQLHPTHSYLLQKCKVDNQSILEERLAMEKRKQAAEEAKLNREKAKEEAAAEDAENTAVLDTLLDKLRNGDNIGRKARRTRPSVTSRPAAPLDLSAASLLVSGTGNETVDLARDMLARLKSDGFDALPATSPTAPTAPRRRSRRRVRGISEDLEGSPFLQAAEALSDEQEWLDSLPETPNEALVESAAVAEESNPAEPGSAPSEGGEPGEDDKAREENA